MAGLWGTGDYRLGWDPCILAVIERWLLCSGFTVVIFSTEPLIIMLM